MFRFMDINQVGIRNVQVTYASLGGAACLTWTPMWEHLLLYLLI